MTSRPASRLLLFPEVRREPVDQGRRPVRRYRLARLDLSPVAAERRLRFEHIRRSYD